MKPWLKTLIWILIVVAVLAGIRYLVFPKSDSGAKGGPSKASVSPIKIAIAQLVGASEQIRLSGAVLTPNQIVLQSEISGLLTYVHPSDGKQVAAGTVLYRLRDDEYQAQYRKILANLEDARRIQRLESDLQKVQGTTVDAFEQARYRTEALRADSAYWQSQIQKTVIKAPFSGVLGFRKVAVGSMVSSGTALNDLVQIHPLQVEVGVPERFRAQLKPGLSIRISSGDNVVLAKLESIGPLVDPTTRTIPIRATIPNQQNLWAPGSAITAELSLKLDQEVVRIPTLAIVPVLDGKKVFTIKNGLAKDTLIETGTRDADGIQVFKGLQVGDTVVISGQHQLKRGQVVKLINAKP
jgi:membrane fusion protein (multidrug efflux system)